jgi:hypothetical protein
MHEELWKKVGVPDGVICPMPDAWNKLYQMLIPHIQRNEKLTWPCILSGWEEPLLTKMLCFNEHLVFADRVGLFEEVSLYLQKLNSEQWFRG